MSDRPGPQAGGFLIAVAILVGTVIGAIEGQPSIGLLAGALIGIAAATALWLADRAKRGG